MNESIPQTTEERYLFSESPLKYQKQVYSQDIQYINK